MVGGTRFSNWVEYRKAVKFLSSPLAGGADDRSLVAIAGICQRCGDNARASAAYWAAARMMRGRGEHQKAAALFKRVVALVPREPGAHLELGECLVSLSRKCEAAFEYRAAALLLKDTSPTDALELMHYAVALDPDHQEGRIQLRLLRQASGVPPQLSFEPAIAPEKLAAEQVMPEINILPAEWIDDPPSESTDA